MNDKANQQLIDESTNYFIKRLREMADINATQQAEIDRLKAELKELKKDKARLDFLESSRTGYGKGVELRVSGTGRGMRLHETDRDTASTSVRAAIDYALAKQGDE